MTCTKQEENPEFHKKLKTEDGFNRGTDERRNRLTDEGFFLTNSRPDQRHPLTLLIG